MDKLIQIYIWPRGDEKKEETAKLIVDLLAKRKLNSSVAWYPTNDDGMEALIGTDLTNYECVEFDNLVKTAMGTINIDVSIRIKAIQP